MWLIAGLGNPEKKYNNSRHNTGFEVIDVLSEKFAKQPFEEKFKGKISAGTIGGERVYFLKPATYMNSSGESIQEVLHYYKIPLENVIVICDDVSFDIGILRVRPHGSAGGHNGLKSIIQNCGGENFIRVRVGVGKKPEEMDLVDFVLGHFSREEKKEMEEMYRKAALAAEEIIRSGIDSAMNKFNKKA